MIRLSAILILFSFNVIALAEDELVLINDQEIAQISLDILAKKRPSINVNSLQLSSISAHKNFGENSMKSNTRIDAEFRVPSSKNIQCSELTEAEKNQLLQEAIDKLDGKICVIEFATYRVEFQASHPKITASVYEHNLHLLK